MKNQKGQVVLLLILVMTVALAIGLSVIQRSLVDVSTSTKVEESSRAFSAAEAGIEKVLSGGVPPFVDFSAENNSSATVTTYEIPALPSGGNRQDPFECPPGDSRLAKEEVAQIWLAHQDSSGNPPAEYYKQSTLDVYWGNSATDMAALEVTIVYYGVDPVDGQIKYLSRKWYLDHASASRPTDNEFDKVDCTGNIPGMPGYQCKKTLGDGSGVGNGPLLSRLMLLRARLLYNAESQPFAVQGTGNCGSDCSLPTQAKVLQSKGTSGQTRRIIQVCQMDKVVPSYFDYAIFSENEINK